MFSCSPDRESQWQRFKSDPDASCALEEPWGSTGGTRGMMGHSGGCRTHPCLAYPVLESSTKRSASNKGATLADTVARTARPGRNKIPEKGGLY